jgi:uncharacterized protein involved in exopolysaccharide biosynthesis
MRTQKDWEQLLREQRAEMEQQKEERDRLLEQALEGVDKLFEKLEEEGLNATDEKWQLLAGVEEDLEEIENRYSRIMDLPF